MSKLKSLLAVVALTITSMTVLAQNDWQSRKDRENAATSASSITNNGGRWDAKAEAERARARAQQSGPRFTAHLTNCGGGFCNDEYGNSYTISGQMLIRQDGKACTTSGNLVDCR